MSADQQVVEGFVTVCVMSDLAPDRPSQFRIGAEYVAVVLTQGEVFAIRDVCSHADVALSEGEVDDCHIECWMHGSRFDLRTGVPDSPPAVRSVPVFDVRIEGEGPDATVMVNPTPR